MTTPNSVPGYRQVPWPPIRDLVVDFVAAGRAVPSVYGFIEIDVTDVKLKLATLAQRDRRISFTAYLTFCLGRALEKHPMIHGLRQGKHIVCFDDVDVNTLLEKQKPDGSLIPVMYIVRSANRKSLTDINRELRAAVQRDLLDDPGVKRRARLLSFPAWVRRGLLAWARRNPFSMKRHWGTVGLSNLGSAVSSRFAVGTSFTIVTLSVIAGSIYTKVMWIDEKATPRQVLGVTLLFDHNLLDGGPAARFTEEFARTLELATGLDELLGDEPASETDATGAPP
ncbi:MAG TPA: 2-oxo acid dehydrogenase subunit E2 [Polyangiaceae bacterium]|nr:2-oxo acid dehydrogenase subunit E2 [Polyangiaceae bacterium]